MKVEYRKATSSYLARCFEIRGSTQDNAFNKSELEAIGVTEKSWAPLIENQVIIGHVATKNGIVIGFCFGDTNSGEILVLAVLAGHEGEGIGKKLLELTGNALFAVGH